MKKKLNGGKAGKVEQSEAASHWRNGLMLFGLTSESHIDVAKRLKSQDGWEYDWFSRVWSKSINGAEEAISEVQAIEALGFTVKALDDTSMEPGGAKLVVGICRSEVVVRLPKMAEQNPHGTEGAGITTSKVIRSPRFRPIGKAKSHMYDSAKTWNPYKGCGFDCSYCKPSFQAQAKRQKHNCAKCYRYEPHTHPERLARIPSADIVFVCGNGDIAFCEPGYLGRIVEAITNHRGRKAKDFYLQSKQPSCLKPFVETLPENVILVTTLETNRDDGYGEVSKAPKPSERFRQFIDLDYPRKVVTIEPVMDFDVKTFAAWIIRIKPEYVWLGLNSRNARLKLPEPSPEKLREFTAILIGHGIEIRGKDLRGIELPGVKRFKD